MIPHRGRRAAEQRAHLGTGLRETEDVVHKEQHVLSLFIPEILGHRQCRQRHAHTGSGRLVHLTVHQPDSGAFGKYRQALVVVLGVTVFVLLGLDHIGLDHLIVEIVAFTGPLTHAREHRDPAVQFRDVVDQLHDHHSLAHARATKRAHFTALQERADEIDYLDAGAEHLRGGGLVLQLRSQAVDGVVNVVAVGVFVRLHGALFVHGITGHVKHAAHHAFTHGHTDRLAVVGDIHATLQTLGGAHGHGAHPVVAQMLLHLERQFGGFTIQLVLHGECVVDGGQLLGELRVHHGANDLYNLAFVHGRKIVV